MNTNFYTRKYLSFACIILSIILISNVNAEEQTEEQDNTKLFSAGLVLAMALTFSCSSDDGGGGGSSSSVGDGGSSSSEGTQGGVSSSSLSQNGVVGTPVTYEGQTYQTVVIGTQRVDGDGRKDFIWRKVS